MLITFSQVLGGGQTSPELALGMLPTLGMELLQIVPFQRCLRSEVPFPYQIPLEDLLLMVG